MHPTPLKNPRPVVHSPNVAGELGFREDKALSEAFVEYFSGKIDDAFEHVIKDNGTQGMKKAE